MSKPARATPLLLGTLLALAVPSPARASLPAYARLCSVEAAGGPAAVPVFVLAPPSYASEPGRRFPVVYFLHDGQGDEEVLLTRGLSGELHEMMQRGELPEFLLVSPRGVGSWWVDSYDGESRVATFLTQDLVPWVDRTYRTEATRARRAAVGISMGGYGALRWGLTDPQLFAAVGGLSPAVQQLTWSSIEALPFFLRPTLHHAFGSSAEESTLRRNDLYQILLSRPELAAIAPEVLVRCGTEDKYRLGELTRFWKKYLDAMGVANELVLEPGGHDWGYWRRALPELLRDVVRRLS